MLNFLEQKIASSNLEQTAKSIVLDTLEKTASEAGTTTDEVLLEFGFEKAAEYLKEAAFEEWNKKSAGTEAGPKQGTFFQRAQGKAMDAGNFVKNKATDAGKATKAFYDKNSKAVNYGAAGVAGLTGVGLGVRALLKKRKAAKAVAMGKTASAEMDTTYIDSIIQKAKERLH